MAEDVPDVKPETKVVAKRWKAANYVPRCKTCGDSGFVPDPQQRVLHEVLPPDADKDREPAVIVTGFRRCPDCRSD